jgi:uracil-DNA glycosylase
MSLDLDPRQRAMLQEMGVRVWLPAAAVDLPVTAQTVPPAVRAIPEAPNNAIEDVAAYIATTGATAQNGLKTSAPPETQETAVSTGVLAADVASLDWAALTQTIATCQACPLCTGRHAAVLAAPDGPRLADWLVVGEPPDDADERAGTPFAGAAGQLLDNMLKALGLSRHAGSGVAAPAAQAVTADTAAYVTPVVKCRPAQTRNPTQAELASCENYLRREVALVRPKVILALGRFAAQGLLQGSVPGLAGTPLGQLRGQTYRYQGIPVIVSYPPSYLLRSPQHKARAWVDLCRAQEALRRGD